MGEISELFWNASVEEIKRGYVYQEETEEFICLVCGESFERGVIYSYDYAFYEAEKFARLHITEEHSSMFDYLLSLEKKVTGLTEIQKGLLRFFAQGLSDSEIVKQMDGGSTSTIRNHRFALREKEKQAKVFLAIMGLLEGQTQHKSKAPHSKRINKPSQERTEAPFAITEAERESLLAAYFPAGVDGPLREFPKKEKRKFVILQQLIKRFEQGHNYSEAEVNEILLTAFSDVSTLRRYLIDFKFLSREEDGSSYWVTSQAESEAVPMDKRAELKFNYKHSHRPMGVYQFKNLANGKVLVGSSANLPGMENRHRFMLRMGNHVNKELQKEWYEWGAEQFSFEVLEHVKPQENLQHDYKDELQEMEAKWIEKLQPFGEKGYNKS